MPVEVRAEDKQHPSAARPGIEQRLDELPPLLFGATEREDLLELVDDQDDARRLRGGKRSLELLQRMLSRREDHGVGPLHSRLELGHDARTNERRLSASGGADDGEECVLLQASDQIVDKMLTAEEEIPVLRLERL